MEHFEILTYNANTGIFKQLVENEISPQKIEKKFPILDLPYNIGIFTNIVHIPTFDNLSLPPPLL